MLCYNQGPLHVSQLSDQAPGLVSGMNFVVNQFSPVEALQETKPKWWNVNLYRKTRTKQNYATFAAMHEAKVKLLCQNFRLPKWGKFHPGY